MRSHKKKFNFGLDPLGKGSKFVHVSNAHYGIGRCDVFASKYVVFVLNFFQLKSPLTLGVISFLFSEHNSTFEVVTSVPKDALQFVFGLKDQMNNNMKVFLH